MVSDSLFILTVTSSFLIALISVVIYHRIDFRTERHERWFIKAGIFLLPVYAFLEFGMMPESALPEALLAATGVALAYAFHGFHKEVIN